MDNEDKILQALEGINSKLDKMEVRLDSLENHVSAFERCANRRFNNIDEKLDIIIEKIGYHHNSQFQTDRLVYDNLSKKVSNLQKRLDTLEKINKIC